MTRKRGISLVELVIALGIFSVALFGVATFVGKMTRSGESSKEIGEFEKVTQSLVDQMLSVGRTAKACRRVVAVVEPLISLECDVNFSMPPTGPDSTMRFALLTDAQGRGYIDYQKKDGPTWKSNLSYRFPGTIENFVICDDAIMTAGTCPIVPVAMSTRHAANLVATDPTLPGRFFRFQINGKNGTGDTATQVSAAGSFYLRNPTSINKLFMAWGRLQ